ncbi:peptidyl-tRNA hydrolase [Mycoplasma wenyonii str. Massachusetts]|uniref:Peptidyl-tRNA hydrolase n=1 Tax=Mycoplasma wenyonii (strain Massachusetts) TaxID=1197325 RepID=I6YAG7_MYCWM|nr:aminoacyl-tRNA hydrolase [Mycoplasma wenyonii]AFN64941.1 peptidyl-tRNA hydrolase [Mycoplasma wenyonii str. Massachusetts]
MKIIVGLGNPTKEYENTRHNLGFQVIDQIQAKLGCSPFSLVNGSMVSKNNSLKGNSFILCKPYEYMNSSGQSLKKTLRELKLDFENVLLIYDELDISIGNYKLIKRKEEKIKHLGVRNVETSFPLSQCLKLKVGIRPTVTNESLVIRNYVMENFTLDERNILDQLQDSIFQLVKRFILLSEKELKDPINYLKK